MPRHSFLRWPKNTHKTIHARGERPRARLRVEQLEARELLAAQLTVTPITWNIIGLDSNNVTAGPDTFPVGVRVANTGNAAATNVQTNYVWDSTNSFINLLGPATSTVGTLAPGASADIIYNV